MAVLSFMDASEFDSTKAYFNKMKTKEEISFIALNNYNNEELNETVKAVVVDEDVENFIQGVIYIRELDYTESTLELADFLEEHVDPVDIYTYVVKLSDTFNDLRVLTKLVSKYTDNKVRFIGGNLLALEGTGVGFFPESFIASNKIKSKPSVRFDFTRVRLVESDKLVVRDISEYQARKTQVKKSKVKKERSKSKTGTTKTAKKKKNVMDILGSY